MQKNSRAARAGNSFIVIRVEVHLSENAGPLLKNIFIIITLLLLLFHFFFIFFMALVARMDYQNLAQFQAFGQNKYALRVLPAVTRLTVYRRLQVTCFIGWCHLWVRTLSTT